MAHATLPPWGGIYMDEEEDAAKIRDCFSLADQIVAAAQAVLTFRAGSRLTIVGSDFYGSYGSAPGRRRRKERPASKSPEHMLAKALQWLISV